MTDEPTTNGGNTQATINPNPFGVTMSTATPFYSDPMLSDDLHEALEQIDAPDKPVVVQTPDGKVFDALCVLENDESIVIQCGIGNG